MINTNYKSKKTLSYKNKMGGANHQNNNEILEERNQIDNKDTVLNNNNNCCEELENTKKELENIKNRCLSIKEINCDTEHIDIFNNKVKHCQKFQENKLLENQCNETKKNDECLVIYPKKEPNKGKGKGKGKGAPPNRGNTNVDKGKGKGKGKGAPPVRGNNNIGKGKSTEPPRGNPNTTGGYKNMGGRGYGGSDSGSGTGPNINNNALAEQNIAPLIKWDNNKAECIPDKPDLNKLNITQIPGYNEIDVTGLLNEDYIKEYRWAKLYLKHMAINGKKPSRETSNYINGIIQRHERPIRKKKVKGELNEINDKYRLLLKTNKVIRTCLKEKELNDSDKLDLQNFISIPNVNENLKNLINKKLQKQLLNEQEKQQLNNMMIDGKTIEETQKQLNNLTQEDKRLNPPKLEKKPKEEIHKSSSSHLNPIPSRYNETDPIKQMQLPQKLAEKCNEIDTHELVHINVKSDPIPELPENYITLPYIWTGNNDDNGKRIDFESQIKEQPTPLNKKMLEDQRQLGLYCLPKEIPNNNDINMECIDTGIPVKIKKFTENSKRKNCKFTKKLSVGGKKKSKNKNKLKTHKYRL